MVRKSYTPEQILNKLREAEILLNQGTTLSVVWKKIGVSDCTYYRRRKEYGGMRIEQAKPEPRSGTTHLHHLMRNGLPRRLLHWQLPSSS